MKSNTTQSGRLLLLFIVIGVGVLCALAINFNGTVGAQGAAGGERITFSSERDGNFEVYVMNADGSSQTRLTDNPVVDADPTLSPDGNRIAFTSFRDGDPEIYIMNADGSNPTRLTFTQGFDFAPSFSPDGSRIAFASFASANFEIHVMNVDGSNNTRLTRNPAGDFGPTFSPDGNRIAFFSLRDGNEEVYIMNADGTNQTRLTTNAAFDADPTFSPDGTRIAFTSTRDNNNEIYVMNSNGSNLTRLTTNAAVDREPAFSPSGSRIAFRSNRDGDANAEVYVMNANGTNQTRLTNAGGFDGEPSFGRQAVPPTDTDGDGVPDSRDNCPTTPNPERIAFRSDRDGNDEIYVMNPNGTNPIRLTNNSAGDFDPSFSPGSNRIAFVSARDGNNEIYIMNSDGTNQTRLTNNAALDLHPTFSPDGSKIAFTTFRDGAAEVYVMNADGTNQTNQTNRAAPDFQPTFSPDGSRIAFVSTRNGPAEIYVMNSDGTNQTRLTNNAAEDTEPAFSPDGGRIAFRSNRDGNSEIYAMNSDGTLQRRLTTNAAADVEPTFSPGSSRIAFRSDRDGNNEIYVMNSDGTNQMRLTTNAASDIQPSFGGQPDADTDGAGDPCDRNFAPNAMDDTAIVSEDSGANPIGVLANDDDPDGDALTIISVTQGTQGGMVQINGGGTGLTYQPPAGFGGADSFTYTISDGNGEEDTAIVRITVVPRDTDGDGVPDSQDNCPTTPNPERIAFTSFRNGNQEIYVMNSDGTNLTNLTNNPAGDVEPAFSPDGRKIAFRSARDGNSEIYVMNADGSNPIRLTNDPEFDFDPAFSPDGSKIAFVSTRDRGIGIFVMNANGTNQINLTNDTTNNFAPAFSPDGSKIAFTSRRDGDPEIYIMNANGSNLTRLTTNAAADERPAFSPDGSRIAFASNRDGNFEIYVMNSDGTNQTRLTTNAATDSDPAFPSRGNRIAFVSDRDGNFEIYAMGADGADQMRLTNNPAIDVEPAIIGQADADGDGIGDACDGNCAIINLDPPTLPNGTAGTNYNQVITATGDNGPFAFSISNGSLPPGLMLNSSTGVLSGAPTVAGTFNFTITATTANGCSGNRAYTVQITGGSSTSGLQYYPLAAPVRLLDTRTGQPACDTPGAPLAPAGTRTQAARTACAAIPANALAIVGNATVVNTTTAAATGFITLYPSGAMRPNISNLNYTAGQVVPNSFTVGLSAGGSFDIYSQTETHFIVDVTGYYAPPQTGGLYYHALSTPVRLLDTRAGQPACDTPRSPLTGGVARQQVARTTCNGVVIPAEARAVVGNATVVNNTGAAAGFVTLYQSGATRPIVSNLNYTTGQIVPNSFTVGLGSGDGAFQIYATTSVNFIVDIAGYYSDQPTDINGAGLLYYPLTSPVRLLDTRSSQTACDTPGAPLVGGVVYPQVAERTCGGQTIPASAQAIAGNATVVHDTGSGGGFVTLYPSDTGLPTISNLNYIPGQIVPNAFTVRLGADGAFNIYASTTTNFIVDVAGYFAP